MSLARRRRLLFSAGTLLAVPRIVRAQAPKQLPVLGILSFSTPISREAVGFRRLRELGWIEGKTLIIEEAYASGATERLPELAAELVRKKVDVIWTISSAGAVAAARATKSIPIIFVRVTYPLEIGLAESFARPGRNVTGVASDADVEVYLKRFQFLREILPGAKRLAEINPGTAIYTYPTVSGGVWTWDRKWPVSEAKKLGFDLSEHFVDKVEDFDAAFAAIAASGAQALVVAT